ncbi:MAG TPA: tyrosine-type recombinase/integrase [Acidimicrobiales bacterium]|nr:tyrosine-type recombinase/integrase [Acidimicrobiales bacterium]
MAVDEANRALLESWELSLHRKRPRTVAHYLSEVERFARWLAAHDRPAGGAGDLAAVTKRDAESWIADQRANGLAGNTIRNRWVAMRSFYGWAVEEEEVPESPFARVVVDRPDTPPPATLTDAELAALLGACKGQDFDARRDLALIRLLAATGLRASEVTGLALDDIDLANRIARVEGKGGRYRIVRFDPATAVALDRYKRIRARHRYAARPELWIGHRGPLSRKGLGPILERRAARAGIERKVWPHLLRHGFADRFLAAGGQEGDLLRLGGWSDPAVMRRYGAARAQDRALAAYDDLNVLGEL